MSSSLGSLSNGGKKKVNCRGKNITCLNVVGKGLCLYVEDLDEFFSVEILEGTIFLRFLVFRPLASTL
jgi:hypothetical protein